MDLPKVDVPKVDVPKVDPPGLDLPGITPPKKDAPKTDLPKTDLPKIEVPGLDLPGISPPKKDATKPAPKNDFLTIPGVVDGPKKDVPKNDNPLRIEPPAIDKPKKDAPKVDAPKVEPPAVPEPLKVEPPPLIDIPSLDAKDKKDAKAATVSGAVTVDGKGLPAGFFVTLVSAEGKRYTTIVQKEGVYGFGTMIPVGPYRVAIEPALGADAKVIPARYQDAATSGLVIQVDGGKANTDLRLTK